MNRINQPEQEDDGMLKKLPPHMVKVIGIFYSTFLNCVMTAKISDPSRWADLVESGYEQVTKAVEAEVKQNWTREQLEEYVTADLIKTINKWLKNGVLSTIMSGGKADDYLIMIRDRVARAMELHAQDSKEDGNE